MRIVIGVLLVAGGVFVIKGAGPLDIGPVLVGTLAIIVGLALCVAGTGYRGRVY